MEFKTIINKLSSFTDEAWHDLTELFEEFTLNKNEYLITEGQKAHRCYYLKDGVIRVFYTHEGNEYNKTFLYQGLFQLQLPPFFKEIPHSLVFRHRLGFYWYLLPDYCRFKFKN